MAPLAPLIAAWMAGMTPASEPPGVTVESLLAEMTDRAAIARLPVPAYTCRQSSSYDRRSTDPSNPDGWFANSDVGQFVRVEHRAGRTEFVMHDEPGPGAIVRLWSANPRGTLRVYLDGSDTAVIEAPMADLLRGAGAVEKPLSVETAKGCNLYLPIPYASRCVITSDADGFYYHVNYRTYEPSTPVLSLPAGWERSAAPAIAGARAALDAQAQVNVTPLMRDLAIEPGARQAADLPAGPRAVTRFYVTLKADDLDRALRSTIVRMTFDGEETVWCPVGELFATGPGVREFRTWWAGATADGTLRLRFPMPFESRASIAFENVGDRPVMVSAYYAAAPWNWDDRSMHFHATWRCQYPLHTRPMSDWNYVTIQGRGVYVGDTLSLVNPVKDWWGEGDEKIYVDGEAFPSHFGTGTEDYYSFAWSNPRTFSGPFNAQPRSDGEALGNCWGRATVTRTRSLDAIPFSRSLRMDMEVWHWKECDVEYAAAAYFYARPGATTNRAPDPASAARLVAPPPLPPPYRVKDAVECESAQVVARSEHTEVGGQGGFEEDLWSGQQQLWVRARAVGDFVELRIPAPDERPRHLFLHATRSWDYGVVRFSVDGRAAGEPVNLFSGDRAVHATGPIDLGVHTPRAGAFVLRAEVVATDPAAKEPRTYFGLDCVELRSDAAVK